MLLSILFMLTFLIWKQNKSINTVYSSYLSLKKPFQYLDPEAETKNVTKSQIMKIRLSTDKTRFYRTNSYHVILVLFKISPVNIFWIFGKKRLQFLEGMVYVVLWFLMLYANDC